jgi:fructan beta-fructosidase
MHLRRIFSLALGLLTACAGDDSATPADRWIQTTRLEPYRPQLHFSPLAGWMNDPNGMVYFAGEYHLFYQYNPDLAFFGNIHWGHAVSTDLVHWEELPVALAPSDTLGLVYSGSAVVDAHNTSGFCAGGKPCLVAIFTHAGGDDKTQKQSLAYSNDRGRSWSEYAQNPVLTDATQKDFRDPKVFWHAPSAKWVMTLAAGNAVRLYGSPDLKAWRYLSAFTAGTEDTFECPELFELPVEGGGTRWVLKVDTFDGGPYGGSGGRYFVGGFDGATFTATQGLDAPAWLDAGKDFYAAVSWFGAPGGRTLWLGWMNNWAYAMGLPTGDWRGAMTLPRELALRKTAAGAYTLVQRPVAELEVLRAGALSLAALQGDVLEIRAVFDVSAGKTAGFRIGADTVVGYDAAAQELFVERGDGAAGAGFGGRFAGPLAPLANRVTLHVFVDKSSVEVFGNDGERVITALRFPTDDDVAVEALAKPVEFQAHRLGSMWAEVVR